MKSPCHHSEPAPGCGLLRDLLPDQVDDLRFTGMTRSGRSAPGRTFGGSMIGQALLAAGTTVPEGQAPGSLHAYFVSPGDSSRPMRYTVTVVSDGPASALRQVSADQDGAVRLTMLTSFRRFRPGRGPEHQRPAPDVKLSEPPVLPESPGRPRPWAGSGDLGCDCPHGAHIPPCGLVLLDAPEPRTPEPGTEPGAQRASWVRLDHDLGDLPAESAALWHSALLAYESDMGTLGVVDRPHRHEPGRRKAASVDHAMWFHRPFRADDWAWYWQRSPVFTGGRGTFEGSFYDTDGQLVASCAQEVSIRRINLHRYRSPAMMVVMGTSDSSGNVLASALEGWQPGTVTMTRRVDPWTVEAFAGLIGSPPPGVKNGDPLPPLWHWFTLLEHPATSEIGADGHPADGVFLPPIPGRRRMFAGGRLNLARPVPIGADLTATSSVAKVNVKTGRTGEMAFVTVRHELAVGGEPAGREEQDVVYRSEPPGTPPRVMSRAQTGEPEPAGDWRLSLAIDPVLLFRFSALTYNGHRIHYDRPYATEVEGYPDLVIHGPLLALLALELPRLNAPDRTVTDFEYRLVRPAFVPSRVVAAGSVSDSDSAEGDTATAGDTATLTVAAAGAAASLTAKATLA